MIREQVHGGGNALVVASREHRRSPPECFIHDAQLAFAWRQRWLSLGCGGVFFAEFALGLSANLRRGVHHGFGANIPRYRAGRGRGKGQSYSGRLQAHTRGEIRQRDSGASSRNIKLAIKVGGDRHPWRASEQAAHRVKRRQIEAGRAHAFGIAAGSPVSHLGADVRGRWGGRNRRERFRTRGRNRGAIHHHHEFVNVRQLVQYCFECGAGHL